MAEQNEPIQENSTPPPAAGDAAPAELPPPTTSAIELEDLQKQLNQTKDLLLRKAAEFDNYKRRNEAEMGSVIRRANEDLLSDILPVLDDFERSLKAGRSGADHDSFLKGVELIHQKLVRILEGFGVKAFETVGKEFNVEFHDALLQMPRSDVPPHTVIEEVEKGYLLHDRVIRHAKVVVSAAPAEGEGH